MSAHSDIWCGNQLRNGRNLLNLTQMNFARRITQIYGMKISQADISAVEWENCGVRKFERLSRILTGYLRSCGVDSDSNRDMIYVRRTLPKNPENHIR
jgi:hypothetical protein